MNSADRARYQEVSKNLENEFLNRNIQNQKYITDEYNMLSNWRASSIQHEKPTIDGVIITQSHDRKESEHTQGNRTARNRSNDECFVNCELGQHLQENNKCKCSKTVKSTANSMTNVANIDEDDEEPYKWHSAWAKRTTEAHCVETWYVKKVRFLTQYPLRHSTIGELRWCGRVALGWTACHPWTYSATKEYWTKLGQATNRWIYCLMLELRWSSRLDTLPGTGLFVTTKDPKWTFCRWIGYSKGFGKRTIAVTETASR